MEGGRKEGRGREAAARRLYHAQYSLLYTQCQAVCPCAGARLWTCSRGGAASQSVFALSVLSQWGLPPAGGGYLPWVSGCCFLCPQECQSAAGMLDFPKPWTT